MLPPLSSDINRDGEIHQDIIGVIRKHRKDKSIFVIWLDIKKMIERVEKDLLVEEIGSDLLLVQQEKICRCPKGYLF